MRGPEKRKELKSRNLISRFREKDELVQIKYSATQKDNQKRQAIIFRWKKHILRKKSKISSETGTSL